MMISTPYLNNMAQQPFLSLCIPTNGIVEFVIPLLESIYSQDVDTKLFEVVITDNGDHDELKNELAKYKYDNLIYKKSDKPGFLNQISCLEYANGCFLKMVNHKSELEVGVLNKIIEFVKNNLDEKPMLFFSNGQIKEKDIFECDNHDIFLKKVSFWSTWEEGLGIWNEDKHKIENIHYYEMFPAASILFGVREKTSFKVFNQKISFQRPRNHFRNYDFFDVFAVKYIDMINDLRIKYKISTQTFNFARYDIFRRYLISHYYAVVIKKSDKALPCKNIKENFSIYYNRLYYYWMILHCHTILNVKSILRK